MSDQPPSPLTLLPADDYVLTFATVVTKPRHDGWTPDRQRRFILLLREMSLVAAAAKAVGCSAQSAYRLRGRPDAGDFAAAWDRALTEGQASAFDRALDHAVNGVETPHYRRGKMIGTVHRYDSRLLVAALSYSKAIRPYQPGKRDE